MMTTRLLRSNATSPDASMRGVTRRCTGSIPSTSIASISSRMDRNSRSAHIAVEPAPATISTVTSGPICVTAPNAAPAPLRSAAPSSRSRMLSVKLTSTVNGMATSSVGANETREMNQHCSRNSRHWNGLRKVNMTASLDIANNPPTACMGPERFFPIVIPGDHLSAMGDRSFQNRDRRHRSRAAEVVREADAGAVDLVDGLTAQLREELHALGDTGRTRRVALGLQSAAGVHGQCAADGRFLRFEKLVGP